MCHLLSTSIQPFTSFPILGFVIFWFLNSFSLFIHSYLFIWFWIPLFFHHLELNFNVIYFYPYVITWKVRATHYLKYALYISHWYFLCFDSNCGLLIIHYVWIFVRFFSQTLMSFILNNFLHYLSLLHSVFQISNISDFTFSLSIGVAVVDNTDCFKIIF